MNHTWPPVGRSGEECTDTFRASNKDAHTMWSMNEAYRGVMRVNRRNLHFLRAAHMTALPPEDRSLNFPLAGLWGETVERWMVEESMV